jgi:hypothetical protein
MNLANKKKKVIYQSIKPEPQPPLLVLGEDSVTVGNSAF